MDGNPCVFYWIKFTKKIAQRSLLYLTLLRCLVVQSSLVSFRLTGNGHYVSYGHYSVVVCCAVLLSILQCSAVKHGLQCSAMQCRAVQCSAVQCSEVKCSTVQYSAVQCSAVQCRTMQCSTVQCSAVQCSAAHRRAVNFLMPNGTTVSLPLGSISENMNVQSRCLLKQIEKSKQIISIKLHAKT